MSLEPRSIPNKSRKILLLSQDRIGKMEAQLHEKKRIEEEKGAMISKSKSIKEVSEKMTSTWSNTFQGSHKQRLKNMEMKERQDEARRCRIDELEGKYQELRKKFVLDVAKRKLYYETDRVKNLHAAMRLAEAVSDRKEQIQQRERAARLFDELDKEYTRCMQDDVQNYTEEEIQKERERRKIAEKNAKELKKQAAMTSHLKEKEKWENLSEGIALREFADQYTEEVRTETAREQEKKQNYKSMLVDGVDKKQKIQRNFQVLDEAEDTRNKLFNDAKLEMKKLRKETEAQINRQKEEHKKKIAEDLLNRSTSRDKQEKKILKKAEKQKAAKEDRESRKKEDQQRQAQKEIDDFYHKAVQDKKAANIQDKIDHLQERRHLEDLYIQLTKKEEEEEKLRKQAEQNLKHTQLHQIAKKRLERKKDAEDEEYQALIRSLYEEEDTFQEYAKLLTAQCEAKGLNTFPMKKASRPGVECGKGPLFPQKCNIRPKYYASVTDPDELPYIERKATTVDTKSRLGFCAS